MNADKVVRAIAIVAAALMLGAYFLAARIWPGVAGNDDETLIMLLPVICGIAVLTPILLKMARRQ